MAEADTWSVQRLSYCRHPNDLAIQPLFMRTRLTTSMLLTLGLLALPVSIRAQDQGPIAPPPTFEVNRIPSVPHPGPPPIPEQEIIRKFAANEDVMKKAFDTYTYTQSVRFEEETDPVGMLTATGDTYFKDDGQRYWRVTKETKPTLNVNHYTLQDVMGMCAVPYFFLTTSDIANYSFLYAGQQQLDQINTYIFQVKPKALNRKQAFFDGVIWVDDHDFAIVRTWGKFALLVQPSSDQQPFTMFEMYRENFEDKYWLPTYIASDGEITADDGSKLPVKLVIRATDFKHRVDVASPSSPTPAGASPASSPPAATK